MTFKIIHILCSLFLFQNISGFSRQNLVVETKVGLIRGIRLDDGNYTMYLGIPYARVNESFPFGDTLPVPAFEEIFDANNDDVRCPQWFNGEVTGTLDCLHINIHVPDTASSDNRLPVMIYVFGGRFVIGTAGRYLSGPQFLVRHDVIFVSLGYRLGPYGFMCLDIPEVPGNGGLKDQEKAFEWIKNNIEAFGGDVNRMTLFGNSAGAMSIGLHLISDTEKIYRNAILQSGSSLFGNLARRSDPGLPIRLAATLGLETDDIYVALNYLATKNPHEVVAGDGPFPAYNPCVEKSFPGVRGFLLDYPVNIKHKNVQGMSILQGFTSEEELASITEESYHDDLFKNWLTQDGRYTFEGTTLIQAESSVRRFFIGNEDINETVKWDLIDFVSDFSFAYTSLRMIPEYFAGGVQKVYQYVLSYDGTMNYGKISRNSTHLPGAMHADCLGYLFLLQYPGVPLEPSEQDKITRDRMTAMWANFAKFNDPTPVTSELLPVKWEPMTVNSSEYFLNINSTLTLGKAYQHRRMNFWNLFFQLYQKYEFGYRDNDEKSNGRASLASFSPMIIVLGIILNFILKT
ncbi:hypothetical protein O0L34_g9058 [Tuta absoluta]|nr:hypothetical protein O0L34_g9058 [Tuta absoluta]